MKRLMSLGVVLVGLLAACDYGNPPNITPVANGQILTTPRNTALPIILTGEDDDDKGQRDDDDQTLTFSVVTQPSHGSLTGNVPNLTYTPSQDYVGADSFTFKVNDGIEDSAPATISITVTAPATPPTPANQAPVANSQERSTPEDTPVTLLLTGTDPEGQPVTFTIASQPTKGTLGALQGSTVT
jgi:large repetitive protein